VNAKKRISQDLKRTIKDKEIENNVLLHEIEELNVSVNERQHIHAASSKFNTSINKYHFALVFLYFIWCK